MAFYSRYLEVVKNAIDLAELGLKEAIVWNKVNNVAVNEISLKWESLMEESKEKGKEFEDICAFRVDYDCPVWRRLEFVMELFQAYFVDQYVKKGAPTSHQKQVEYTQIILSALRAYSARDLLDDYQHFIAKHSPDRSLKICGISPKQTDDIDEDICCNALLRRQRRNMNRSNDRHSSVSDDEDEQKSIFDIYWRGLDPHEIHIIEISGRIHHFMNHARHCHESKSEDEMKETKLRSLTHRKKSKNNAISSKFMNEMVQNKEENTQDTMQTNIMGVANGICVVAKRYIPHEDGIGLMDNVSDITTQKEFAELREDEYGSDTIIYDVVEEDDRCNTYPQSHLYSKVLKENKHTVKLVKKALHQRHNDDDHITEFNLG
eukprot:742390_1